MTLIELVIAIVVIAVALTGTLMATQSANRHGADPMIQRQALAIAEAYLEEILLQPYLDPDTGSVCPTREANRGLYDNVCDYAGLDDMGARDRNGLPVTGLDGYRVRVGVDTNATLGALSGASTVLRVDVRVTHPSGTDHALSAYRTNS